MSWANEQAFIEQQLVSFHSFLDELWFYKESLDKVSAKVGYETQPVTASYCTNYRDTFWHYAKASVNLNDSNETHTQYRMMLEHLNRATIDLLVNVLQKLYHVNRLIAYNSCDSLRDDEINARYDANERKRLEQRFEHAKNGYLSARKALLMLRSKRSSLYRLISAQSEFNSPSDYHDNTTYYIDVISLFTQSYDLMYAAIINT